MTPVKRKKAITGTPGELHPSEESLSIRADCPRRGQGQPLDQYKVSTRTWADQALYYVAQIQGVRERNRKRSRHRITPHLR